MTVDEDVEDAARDLLELSDDGNRTRKRKQGVFVQVTAACHVFP